MALPDFKKTEQDKNAVPQWAEYLKEGEFISYDTTYPKRKYLNLFDRYVKPSETTGDITYYVYDPVKHGADPHKTYPVTVWFHGLSNSLMGDGCIMCCGAEQYASPLYQQSMGGAYIIVPLANEKRMEDGRVTGGWDDSYIEPIKEICDEVCCEHKENIGKRFVIGASSGGFFTWRMLEIYGNYFCGGIPVSSGYMPSDEALAKISEQGISLLVAHGRHDEMAAFAECIVPHTDKLSAMNNTLLFFPEWVYNGDGGIGSVFYGFEMGQHCMINWIQNNLMFDDGRPADVRLPDGVTGWIRSVSEKD